MRNLPADPIYAITDREQLRGRSLAEYIDALLAADIKIIQYREKSLSKKCMYAECCMIREKTLKANACFIVNDFLDIALAVGADGIHLGQDDLPLSAVRNGLAKDILVGVSVRNMEEAFEALAGGADYLGVGAIFPTQSKADAVQTGCYLLETLKKSSPVPLVAIGGIERNNIGKLSALGVPYFALISALHGAEDVTTEIAALRLEIEKNKPV